MPAQVNLQDVAERAGVHRTTVSLALRDHPRIPKATRERIKAEAARLGYRINPLVSALMQARRSGRSEKHVTIAYVTNYPTRYGWRPPHHNRPDFFPGAAARALDFGYRLEDFWLGAPGMTPRRFVEILKARSISGLIVGRLPPGVNRLELDWSPFSCVALGLTLQDPRLHHVTENHFDTMAQVMRQCRARGYRRVGFVFSRPDDSPDVGNRWCGAYLREQMRYPARERLPICPDDPPDFATFTRWFRRYRPDALIATHAQAALQWLREMDVAVPRDLGMVDLEDSPFGNCAGVWYEPAAIGGLAVEMLVGLMHRNETGVPSRPHDVLISGDWLQGKTLPQR